MANRTTRQLLQEQNLQLQAQNEQLQNQLQQQEQTILNLTGVVNGLAQNFQATQEAIQQLLAQGNQGGQPPAEPQLPDEPEELEEPHEPVAIVPPAAAPVQLGIFTLEKFLKNGAKYFKGTTEPDKAEAWTLNMLKTFRAMEVPENHWVRLASYIMFMFSYCKYDRYFTWIFTLFNRLMFILMFLIYCYYLCK